MDDKKAIIFIKEEIKKLAEQQKAGKVKFKNAQRQVQRLFLNNKMNPYWHWSWIKETSDGRKIYCSYGDNESVLQSNINEPTIKYLWRLTLWKEYCKITGYDYLPTVFYDNEEEITCYHILLNKLRGRKSHTNKDETYENTKTYKALLERMEIQFPIQTETQGGDYASK